MDSAKTALFARHVALVQRAKKKGARGGKPGSPAFMMGAEGFEPS
jgi:hypothetical protein